MSPRPRRVSFSILSWMQRFRNMARIEVRLADMGLALPAPFQVPAHLKFPFTWVRVRGRRAFISGHVPQKADGSMAGPLGKVGADVTAEEGYTAARLVALAHLG